MPHFKTESVSHPGIETLLPDKKCKTAAGLPSDRRFCPLLHVASAPMHSVREDCPRLAGFELDKCDISLRNAEQATTVT
jgi:hypothetical protein